MSDIIPVYVARVCHVCDTTQRCVTDGARVWCPRCDTTITKHPEPYAISDALEPHERTALRILAEHFPFMTHDLAIVYRDCGRSLDALRDAIDFAEERGHTSIHTAYRHMEQSEQAA